MDLHDFGNPENGKENVKSRSRSCKNDPVTQKEKYPGCVQNSTQYFLDFCDKTGMHGFNLLGERRTTAEKIWWTIIILVAFYLCIAMIVQTTKKWLSFPVVVTFATSQTPIWDVPFPAVTICPDIKTQVNLFNYTDAYIKSSNDKELTPEEKKGFEYLSLVCNTPEDLLNETRPTIDEGAIDFLKEVAPVFALTTFEVYWQGNKYTNAEELFTPILTSEGICYSFNIMDRSEIFTDIVTNHGDFFSTNGLRSEWSLDKGYSEDAKTDPYPRRTNSAGAKKGLSLMLLTPHVDLDYACNEYSQGFKVMLHHPAQIPRAKQRFFQVPLDQAVVVAVKPSLTTTSEDLLYYNPEERKCYFTSEKSLKYFKSYNQANCLSECLIDFTLQSCGCVGFHMARVNSTPICSAVQNECMDNAKILFIEKEINYNSKTSRENIYLQGVNPTKINSVERCNCLPSCTSLDFNMELSQCDWDWKEKIKILLQTPSWKSVFDDYTFDDVHLSQLTLFYKDMQFLTSERNELYSQVDFWANVGGILGLFTGFTFISGCEVLCYLTLRLGCNLRKFGRHYWSGSAKLLASKKKLSKNKLTD